LFGNCEDENGDVENGDVENNKIKSFWGKSVKKSNLANYDIQMFANRKR
jgi:hypothetical protein